MPREQSRPQRILCARSSYCFYPPHLSWTAKSQPLGPRGLITSQFLLGDSFYGSNGKSSALVSKRQHLKGVLFCQRWNAGPKRDMRIPLLIVREDDLNRSARQTQSCDLMQRFRVRRHNRSEEASPRQDYRNVISHCAEFPGKHVQRLGNAD